MEKVEFLKNLYNIQCQDGDYVILSVKGQDTPWRDLPIKYNKKTIEKNLTQFFQDYSDKHYDIYFSSVPFNNPKRRIVEAIESKFLFADLDEKTNKELREIRNSKVPPRYLWESSPGKYQCLVEVDRYMDPETMEQYNKSLEDYYQADSCGDIVHVLRVPGTTNHKYNNTPSVKPAKEMGKPLRLKTLGKELKVTEKKEQQDVEVDLEDLSLGERQIYAKYNIPKKVRDLLALTDITNIDRSNTIWFIENKLIEIGMEPNEIILLVKNSAFNKYKGRKDEDKRLRKELDKILTGKVSKDIESTEDSFLKVDSYQEVMGNLKSFPGWLIEGFWGRRSHGIVAGQPKVFKSTFVQDLVISVASGKPFLGQYPVVEPGPVILVQNENADWLMKDRNEKLINHRGIVGKVKIKNKKKMKIAFPPELPIHSINQQGFSFDNETHRTQIEQMIKEIKPVLVVFDPMYLMFTGDLNSASELGPTLKWLLKLKNELNTGIMLIHHYNKGGNPNQSRGGQKMLGSAILHGWVESAWYLKRPDMVDDMDDFDPDDFDQQKDIPTKVLLDREFRLAGEYPQLQLNIKMGKVGDPYYHVEVGKPDKEEGAEITVSKTDIPKLVIETLRTHGDPLTKDDLVNMLGYNIHKINPILDKLLDDGKIISTKDGYTVYK